MDAYDKFLAAYSDYPSRLAAVVAAEKGSFVQTEEDPNYNRGTMEKGAGASQSANIVVANAHQFERAARKYHSENPQMKDEETQARVVFDFLRANGSNFSYEEHRDDVVFGDVTRKQFYSETIYQNALTNTNFFDRHIGNMQIVCMEPKSESSMPRNVAGLPKEDVDKFMAIPTEKRLDILYKRGLYHESVHVAMGTADERKCDAFAMLKVMKEYPEYAETIFELYNMQRSKMGYTVRVMHKKEGPAFEHAVRGGAMTYLMPNTYKKLHEYAQNPDKIPNNDADLLRLTCELTCKPEFSREQLSEFADLMKKEKIKLSDLEHNTILQSCMEQGHFEKIEDYVHSDRSLDSFLRASSLREAYVEKGGNSAEIKEKVTGKPGMSVGVVLATAKKEYI